MSHLKERSDKNCLNCNARVYGKYCHICGQENIEPAESVGHLIRHFFNDITHFDGKFFGTVRYLLFRPGFLSAEYKMGRRVAYLNPVKMYVFTSALFFLLFFSISNIEDDVFKTTYDGKTKAEIAAMDSLAFDAFTREINSGNALSREEFKNYSDSLDDMKGMRFSSSAYASRAAYDSVLKSGKKKPSWLRKQITYREIEMNTKYGNDRKQISRAFITIFTHSFPQMLFVSLPLVAFLLKILYARRKQFFYVDHAIFSLHLYIFTFILLLFHMLFAELREVTDLVAFEFLIALLYIFLFIYQYKAMRNFYGQRRGKTILKFLILNILISFLLLFLLIIFVIFSLMKV